MMRQEPDLEAWPTDHGDVEHDFGLFKLRYDQVQNPRTRRRMRRLVLETPDWCTIVAVTDGGDIVLVKQHRFGIGRFTIEIPGGTVDDGEDSETAARRELAEETGFTARKWTHLGSDNPNPAIHDNLVHHWLAEGAVQTGIPAPGSGEDIGVFTMSRDSVSKAIRDGAITQALGIAALARVVDLT